MTRTLVSVAMVALMFTAGVASAGTWTEVGDAPALLPAQDVVGSGPLDLINGSLLDGLDADIYTIQINDYLNFSATTVGLTSLDTRLYLFDTAGYGITFDDDDPLDGAQSTITAQFLTSNGLYVLGISRYPLMAADAGGAFIWNTNPYNVERQPDGPGAMNPLGSWAGGMPYAGADYGIGLTGASFVPEPASLGLLALGALALLRRR